MSILEIQKALKAAGFDPGPLDGIAGKRTLAALTAFQAARGLSTAQDQWGLTETALRGGSGGVGAPADDWSTYQAKYPMFAWAFQDPEVRAKLQEGMAAGWGPDELQGAIYQTNWWRSKTNAERDWLQTLATNPKEAERQLNNYDSITKYMSLAADYGIPTTFDAAARQVDRVVRGEIAPDALGQELRNMAKGLYPQLAQQLDAGVTVADVYAPYKQIAANLLGVNPEAISLTDAKWQAPLQVRDGSGTLRLATVDEWQTILKTDAKYGYDNTSGARQEAAQFANEIAKTFGRVA